MLRLRAVNQYHGQDHILWDVDLDLLPGCCTAIVGRPGMGKTTLVNCIMGYLPIHSGSIEWKEVGSPAKDLMTYPAQKRAALGIGYVPQGHQLFSQLTVEENLHVALMAGQPDRYRAIPRNVYDLFPSLWSLRHARAGELSNAQQQQLTLARALVLEPKLLILDEPTEGMTPWREEEMGNLIHQLNHDLGLTILLLEQRISLIRRVAHYFCLLHRGRNVAQGRVNQLDDAMLESWMIAL